MLEIEFVGAAQTVTGSKHLIRTSRATILLDCGLFQGRRRESIERNRELGVPVADLDAVVLSHAHIDHSGALPMLAQQGYEGPIFVTPATRDLCAVMLEDAAHIQQSDARFINKLIDRGEADMERVQPLYSENDVLKVLDRMISLPYHLPHEIAPGVKLTFFDAGHVLGSAITALDLEDGDGKGQRRVLFTGDLGRTRIPILRDPELVGDANVLITESTYGDREHPPIDLMYDELALILKRTFERGGKVVIPSFALERAQEVIYALKGLKRQGRLPNMPVYVDSPLTVKITDVFKLHPECYDEDARKLLEGRDSPFDFDLLEYVSEKEDSQAIDASDRPAIVIAASGMCEAGRVVHHLKATVEDPKNTICIVGFQAQHTLGRRIVERRPRVKIFGIERELRAEVAVLNGFSAHADKNDLAHFAEETQKRGRLTDVMLVHGELPAQKTLRDSFSARGLPNVRIPATGERIRL
jgi:metallo-beta-lactamase family protein